MSHDIRMQSVGLRLGNRDFLYDLALHGPGIVAISGPSGAGKSTLFHLLAGFETPSRGQIIINGQDMAEQSPGQRPLTYIFQDHNLFAHLNVFDNVALGVSPSLKLGDQDRAEISRALASVALGGFEQRMTGDLSGGERQRVAFARALVRRRPFLLLDEAFASLDETLRLAMGETLKQLQQATGAMVLMISHDRQEILRLADRVVEIQDGRCAFVGTIVDWQRFAENPGTAPKSLKID